MPPDLPESYYLDNVKTLFEHVELVYADILQPDYLNFLERFRLLSEDAQRLVIRLLNRSNTTFRLSKIEYPEISSIPQALQELNTSGFVKINPGLDKEEILSLFNKAELIERAGDAKSLKKLNRADLNQYLLNEEYDRFHHALADSDTFVQVSSKDIYLLLQMLFFGNLNQSMTDFVLRDLGLYQFESYNIDIENRPYRNAEEIDQHWLLHQLDGFIELCDDSNIDTLLDCFGAIPESVDTRSPIYRKSERLKYDIARQLERLGQSDIAVPLYQQCKLPPSRERQARIHHQQGNIQQALKLCRVIIDAPIDESEHQFANEFATRLIKQNRLDPLPGISIQSKYTPEMIELELDNQPSVEQAVVNHYQRQGGTEACYYLENTLFNGVLGLLIWEAIFAPITGAFHNPFQYRPGDFYDNDFVNKRQHILKPVWSSIQCNDDIWQRASDCWRAKQGLANPLIDWHNLDLDIIQLALQRIPHAHWLKIFQRLLLDLRNNRSGFPDLIVFPVDGDYLLVEVKGPGDTLQKNQRRWMQYFDQNNIPHCVARVNWTET